MPFPKSYATQLGSLTPREAIVDALYRGTMSFDTANEELFESAFTPDAVFDFNGTLIEGLAAIKRDSWDRVSKLDTTHFLTCVRVQHRDGDDTAKITCTAQAEHYRRGEGVQPGSPSFTSGAIYHVDLVRDGDLWRVKYWGLQLIWRKGDAQAIMYS